MRSYTVGIRLQERGREHCTGHRMWQISSWPNRMSAWLRERGLPENIAELLEPAQRYPVHRRIQQQIQQLSGEGCCSGVRSGNLEEERSQVLMYSGRNENLYRASTKARVRSICMQWLSLLVRDRRQATTAWLSHRQRTHESTQRLPQIMPARTMGSSSLIMIVSPSERSSQESWNQWEPCQAPQPQEPEASDAICQTGSRVGSRRKEMPFQSLANSRHHARSDRKALFRRMGCGAPHETPNSPSRRGGIYTC